MAKRVASKKGTKKTQRTKGTKPERLTATRRKARPKTAPRRKTPDPLLPLAEPMTAAPPAPERLGDHGRDCWVRLCPLLVELRLLSPLDLEALEALCHQWHDYLTWHLQIQKDPTRAIVEYESGARQKSPEATLRDAAYDRWLRLLPRFGLSPEYLRKLKRLKPPAGSRGQTDSKVDPVAAFAAQKYGGE